MPARLVPPSAAGSDASSPRPAPDRAGRRFLQRRFFGGEVNLPRLERSIPFGMRSLQHLSLWEDPSMQQNRRTQGSRRSIFKIHPDRSPFLPFLPFGKKAKVPPTEIRPSGTSTTNETSPQDTGGGGTGP